MSRTRGQAFTLIEVLLVMTIIALVVALLLPSLGLAKESSRNVQCMSQERQINLATITYTYDFNYNFPACVGQEVIIERTSLGGTVHQVSERWPARLLPYLGTTDIFRCPVQFITLPVNTYYANTLSDVSLCQTMLALRAEVAQRGVRRSCAGVGLPPERI